MNQLTRTAHSRLRAFLRDTRTRACAAATALFGALSYFYLFANNLNNNDTISCLPQGFGTGISSGRWLLHLLGKLTEKLWGVYNVPLFNGLLALLLLALTSAVLVRALDIRSRALSFALAAVTASVAPIASLMLFQFTVHYYALALLLIASAACLMRSCKPLALLGASLLGACSLGIYQAYFPFFAVLLLLMILGSCLRRETQPKALIFFALRCLGVLAASYLLYWLILHGLLALLGARLSDYQGMSAMGSLSLRGIPRAYAQFFRLTTTRMYGFNETGFVRVMILLLMLSGVGLLTLSWRDRPAKLLIGLAALALMPFAANAFLVLAPDSTIYTRMCMGLTVVFYLPLLIADRLPLRFRRVRKCAVLGVAALLLLTCVNYAWQSNGNYQFEYYANRKAENYFSAMLARIRSAEGYRDEMEIVLVGDTITDAAFQDNWLTAPFHYSSVVGAKSQLNQYSRPAFFANYFGFSARQITQEELTAYSDLLKSMPCYPDSGSIRTADGRVFVMLEQPER